MSDSLRPHGLQHTRLPCPSLSPRVFSKSCPLSRWCYLATSSSATPFSFCLQSFQHQCVFQCVNSSHQGAHWMSLILSQQTQLKEVLWLWAPPSGFAFRLLCTLVEPKSDSSKETFGCCLTTWRPWSPQCSLWCLDSLTRSMIRYLPFSSWAGPELGGLRPDYSSWKLCVAKNCAAFPALTSPPQHPLTSTLTNAAIKIVQMKPPFLWMRLLGCDMEKQINSETWGTFQNSANLEIVILIS